MSTDRVVTDLAAAIVLLMEQLEPKDGSEKLLRDRIRKLEALEAKIEQASRKKRGTK